MLLLSVVAFISIAYSSINLLTMLKFVATIVLNISDTVNISLDIPFSMQPQQYAKKETISFCVHID